MLLKKLVVCAFSAALACGGLASELDAGVDESGVDASGWTQCSSPSGYFVCNGPNACNSDYRCGGCDDQTDPDDLGICLHPVDGGNPESPGGLCRPGTDGEICVLYHDEVLNSTYWDEMPFDVGVLLAQNGGAARARYADLGLWTGDPIPDTGSCPDLGGVQACGGSCGACAQGGATCVGRSPLHPVGICDPNQLEPCSINPKFLEYPCGPSSGCFTYTVQPAAQPDADAAGMCLPLDECNALAQKLPGGGKCTPGA